MTNDPILSLPSPITAAAVVRLWHGRKFDAYLANHARAIVNHWQRDIERPLTPPPVSEETFRVIAEAGARLAALAADGALVPDGFCQHGQTQYRKAE